MVVPRRLGNERATTVQGQPRARDGYCALTQSGASETSGVTRRAPRQGPTPAGYRPDPTPLHLLAGSAVDRLAKKVGVTVVPCVLLDTVRPVLSSTMFFREGVCMLGILLR